MNAGWRIAAWLLLFVAGCAVLWVLSPVLLPFLLGVAIAYLLDPPVRRLERLGLGRTIATLAVMGLFFVIVVTAISVLLPILERQLVGLVGRAVVATQELYNWVWPLVERELQNVQAQHTAPLGNAGDIAGKIFSWGGGFAASVLSGGLAIVNLLSLLVITPVVTFYLLRDWPKIVERIDSWLPRHHATTIQEQVRLIDERLAGFVRGQALVCLLLGMFYAIALTAAGLNYGLLLGLMIGVLAFVPVLGATIGAITALTVAVFQFGDWLDIGIIAGIFLVGQFIESYVLSPKLVGDRVGLHPVWVMLALLAGGTLFGFVGLLIAVPAAATIGVLLHFGLERYIASPLYRGTSQETGADRT